MTEVIGPVQLVAIGFPPAPAPAPSAPEPEYVGELERLSQLRDQGIISDQEFEAKKKQILGI